MSLVTNERVRYLSLGVAWLITAHIAARVEPGALQLLIVVTLLYLVITNLGHRLPGEESAYSVFNGGRALPGQLRAEQFDNEVRHRDVNSNIHEYSDAPNSVETDEYLQRPFRSPDRPGEVLLAPDRHERILAELRREALCLKDRRGRRPRR